jgi:tRNA threonylcarbamoyladenosine biosynthesis protein TsaE
MEDIIKKYSINIKSLTALPEAANEFLSKFPNDKIFAFYGNLGAGKTTFIKALCEKLDVIDLVNSPTFTIINEYKTKNDGTIYHFDLYRINSTEELFDLGIEDYLNESNYCFIEWPEKIKSILPEKYIAIYLMENTDGSRLMNIEAINI